MLVSAALLCLGSTVSAADAPVAAWCNLFDGKTSAGDQNTAIAIGSDNSVYWLNTLGSTEAAPDVFYNGEKIFTGSLYNAGSSYANNFALTKTNTDGAAVWTIYSNSGDYASENGGVAVGEDGSVYFAAKVRHTDGKTDTDLTLVDAEGTAFNFFESVEKRYYIMVIGKADANGKIEWIRTTDVAHGACPSGAKDFIAEGFAVKDIALDAEGNIFVCGSAYMDLSFEKADGSRVTLTPRNTADWSGDAQKACGDLFIAKLDKQGYYLDCLQASGAEAGFETVLSLEPAHGKIYFQGYASAPAAVEPALGGKTLKVGVTTSPFVGCLNPETLSVEWLSCMTSEKIGAQLGYQNSNITAIDGTVWLAAQFNGKFSSSADPTKSVTSKQHAQREGMLVKFSAADGEWLAAADSRDGFADSGIGAYMKAIQNPLDANKVYVYGYVWGTGAGVFLRAYDARTLEADPDNSWTLITSTGMVTAREIAYSPAAGTAYVTARTNKAYTCLGGITTPDPNAWSICAARFNLPESLTSGVENVSLTQVPGETDNTVYDITGRPVGNDLSGLPAGLYITRGKKVLVK